MNLAATDTDVDSGDDSDENNNGVLTYDENTATLGEF
jgi:hypothetical protein